jgi:hypothetical protein
VAIEPEESPEWPQWQEWQQSSHDPYQWTDGDYAIDRVAWLDAVVRNSGWSEVLATDGYLDDVIDTLRAIGADETLGFLTRCLARFPGGWPSNDAHGQIRALSREDRDYIESLNEEYYSSKEDICGMAVKYRRRSL